MVEKITEVEFDIIADSLPKEELDKIKEAVEALGYTIKGNVIGRQVTYTTYQL